jgi:hypothetical protein
MTRHDPLHHHHPHYHPRELSPGTCSIILSTSASVTQGVRAALMMFATRIITVPSEAFSASAMPKQCSRARGLYSGWDSTLTKKTVETQQPSGFPVGTTQTWTQAQ